MELSLEDAINGREINISVPTLVSCNDCDGTGAHQGKSLSKCPQCNGVGQVRMSQGFFSVQQTCPRCAGRGKIIEKPCIKCSGAVRYEKTKKLSVKIPSGVDNGDQVRLTGEGEAGSPGTSPGDLYVSIRVKPHRIFQREGNDLLCEVPINFTSAILGDNVIVPTLGGKVELKIPKGTQSGKTFRMKNKGVRSVRSRDTGDLYCRVNVETPVNLTKKQEDLIKELDESLGRSKSKHSPKQGSWYDSIKDFFE